MSPENTNTPNQEPNPFETSTFEAFLGNAAEIELKAETLKESTLSLLTSLNERGVENFIAGEGVDGLDYLITPEGDLTELITAYAEIDVDPNKDRLTRLFEAEQIVIRYKKYEVSSVIDLDGEDYFPSDNIAAITLDVHNDYLPKYANGTPIESSSFDYVIKTVDSITQATKSGRL